MSSLRPEVTAVAEQYLQALAALVETAPGDLGTIQAFRQAARIASGDRWSPIAPPPEVLDARCRTLAGALVDIVVPVHNALDDVKACLASLRSAATPRLGQVWLVDDASDDETAAWLATQPDGTFRYLRLPQNLGFTHAVAAGLAQTKAKLVIVLNSDTLVAAGWIEALAQPFATCARVALTGPLSNAAAWQSLGRVTDGRGLFATNRLPEGVDAAAVTAFLKAQIGARFVELPMVHGFCFMLARDAYDAAGGFDLENFGRGYGETQDLGLRLKRAGYRIGLASDVFVEHGRSRSYSDAARDGLSRDARRTLYRKYGALDYLLSEAACIDHADLAGIRATAAGWFARDGLDVPYFAADSARPTEFAEIAARSSLRRMGRRGGRSLVGLPRADGAELAVLSWAETQCVAELGVLARPIVEPPLAPPPEPGSFDALASWVTDLEPLEEIVAHWRHKSQSGAAQSQSTPAVEAGALVDAIRAACPDGVAPVVVISISHDNYLTSRGGVQFCLQQEEAIARARGTAYLNLHPAQPLPRLAHLAEDPDLAVNLVLNGRVIGQGPMSEVIAAAAALAADGVRQEVVVHHLLGHNPEQIADLVRACGAVCWFWLHDFFSVCPGFTLMRNDLTYCGAPAPGSNACTLCLYGTERPSHLARLRRLAETVEIRPISPSDFMAHHWGALQGLPVGPVKTVPHVELVWQDLPPSAEPVGFGQTPLTIAFLGNPAFHKGWSAFRDLAQDTLTRNAPVRFLHLGTEDKAVSGIDWQFVQVSAEDPDAMVRALRDNAVDFVLHWANWPETFSFTAFEALTAGAWVITRPESGNVAATMARIRPDLVLPDLDALKAMLAGGRLAALAVEVRRSRGEGRWIARRSEMSFAALEGLGLP